MAVGWTNKFSEESDEFLIKNAKKVLRSFVLQNLDERQTELLKNKL